MVVNNLGQFKHGYLIFASEYNFKFSIRVDHPLVHLILKSVSLNVIPDFFDNLCAGSRLVSITAAKAHLVQGQP